MNKLKFANLIRKLDMRTLYVCNILEMPLHAHALRPSNLISLVAPEEQPPTPSEVTSDRHLRVEIHDICEPLDSYIVPTDSHISCLIDFLYTWDGSSPLLIHCIAGVSRSMAAALIALSLFNRGCEAESAHYLRLTAPHAHPNRRIIAIADEILGCKGRLVAARESMGTAEPIQAGPLVRLPVIQSIASANVAPPHGLVGTWN